MSVTYCAVHCALLEDGSSLPEDSERAQAFETTNAVLSSLLAPTLNIRFSIDLDHNLAPDQNR